MSSNAYGFTCDVPWEGRRYGIQVIYKDTDEDDPDSRDTATADWESEEPADLARYELDHRDWGSDNPHSWVRIQVWFCWGGWKDGDPASDPKWDPPQPTEREILTAIAEGKAEDFEHGWDT